MRRAVLDADSAADAALGDDARLFAPVLFNHLNRVDGANLHALAAADALFRVYPRYEVRAYRLRDAEALYREHRLAAAGAAVADEVHAAADVLAELHEVIVVGLREKVAALGRVDLTGVAVLDERRGGGVEGHADVHRRVAGVTLVHSLVAAVAHADAYVRGRVYDVRRALVVEHLEHVFVGDLRLLREDAPHLDVAAADEVAHEVLLDRYVLVEELAQRLLVNVVTHAHQRELKKSRHRRRHGVYLLSVLLYVDDERLAREAVEHLLRLVLRHLPDLRRLVYVEGLYRKLGHQPRFLFGHQYLEYVVEELRLRRSLRETVQPFHQPCVRRTVSVVVRHFSSSPVRFLSNYTLFK